MTLKSSVEALRSVIPKQQCEPMCRPPMHQPGCMWLISRAMMAAARRFRCSPTQAVRLRVDSFIQALGFAVVFLAGCFTPGQVGGAIAGAAGAAAFLALNGWGVPAMKPLINGLRWRLFRDPRLASWPRLRRWAERLG